MLQAIETKYIGPTNYRGSRVKATAAAGSVTIGWDDALNSEQNHWAAARALIEKYGWGGVWAAGGLPSERGDVFVCLTRYDSKDEPPRLFDIHNPDTAGATRGPWRYESGCVYAGEVRIALMDREEPGTAPWERDANARLIASMR